MLGGSEEESVLFFLETNEKEGKHFWCKSPDLTSNLLPLLVVPEKLSVVEDFKNKMMHELLSCKRWYNPDISVLTVKPYWLL